MKQAVYLFRLFLFFLLLFAIGKAGFLLYNRAECVFTLSDIAQVWWHGLSMDASTSGYLITLPWLCCIASLWWKFPFRRVILPYLTVVALLLSSILLGDTLLYAFWKFKIDSSILTYLQNPEGAVASVSTPYLICSAVCFLLISGGLLFALFHLTPKWISVSSKPWTSTAGFVLMGGLIFLIIRGGVQESTMNVGKAYYSSRQFLNHAAVNPTFSIFSSLSKNKAFDQQFRMLEPTECQRIFAELYPTDTEDVTDTLLTTRRPQVLVLLLESFGAKFLEELGGIPDVSPNLNRLAAEGVLFDQVYANSYRTDRGLVSALSGHVSFPTATLMKLPSKLGALPSLAHSLRAAGYSTDYAYGGDITYVGMQGYLISAGFERLISDRDFSFAQVNESKWGANDSLLLDKVYQQIQEQPMDDSRWFSTVLTLSSHEPFEVPYHRLDDPVLNAFAYTDHCVGQFINKLHQLPVWEDLLVILMPDHGMMYQTSFENPEYFHIPVIWTGGAVKEPRRISTLMNQSDVAATLLGQLGLPHSDFLWSRNVLSLNYIYPFAYSTFPTGILFADSTGVSIFDINSQQEILTQPSPSTDRVQKAKAILQSSYDELSRLGTH